MKANANIVALAGNCGIDARGMTVKEVREAYVKQRGDDKFADQHDARLTEALDNADKVLNESVKRMVAEVVTKSKRSGGRQFVRR
jgi:hypothetical protein